MASEVPKFSVIQCFRIPKLNITHWTASLGKIYFDEAAQCLIATNGKQLFKYSQDRNILRPLPKGEYHDVFQFYVNGGQRTIAWTPGQAIFAILNNGRG